MEIYFSNDGTYDKTMLKMPVLIDDKPIGYIKTINGKTITCEIFDRYISHDKILNKRSPTGFSIVAINIKPETKYEGDCIEYVQNRKSMC